MSLAPSGATPYPGIGSVDRSVVIRAASGADARTVRIDVSKPDFATGELTVGEDASVIVQGVTLDCVTRACFYPNVVNHGALTLRSVTVTDASAGAILQQPQDGVTARLTVLGSAIVHNSDLGGFGSSSGAGIEDLPSGTNPSFVVVANSTIADNTANQNGGGIDTNTGGHVTLTNVTFTGNHAQHGAGGGLHNDLVPGFGGNPVRLDNALFAGNGDGASVGPDCAAGWSTARAATTCSPPPTAASA